MFNKDFLKESGISNEEDNQFFLHQDSSFNLDGTHQNGFGLQGYGGQLNHLTQQRSVQPPSSGLPPQQLYRPSSTPLTTGNQSQDSLHFLNSRPGGFPQQGNVIGGGSGLTPGRNITEINGRLPGAIGDVGLRFPGPGSQFNPNMSGQGREEHESDDFPALPSSGILGSKQEGSLGGSSLLSQPSNRSGQPSLYPSGLGAGLSGLDSSNITSSNTSLSGATTNSVPNSQVSPAAGLLGSLGISSTPASAGLSKESKYGMPGLLEVLRSQDKDSQTLSLGTDLTTFGLNLNSVETLFTSFVSPFVDAVPSDEPQYKTPQCYLMAHAPVLKADHWSKLTVETLFYIFYQLPRDILQACAAQELYRRDWKYHGELKIWIKPHNRPDLMQQTPQFVFFDAKAWEQKYLNTQQLRGNLLAGLLSEEEIRVKVPLPGQNSVVEP